ncbi:hypothetical protein RZS48_10800 [Alcaligenes faecalis]|nr:hypothetical protein [Alcaligenes faecalis]
MNQRLYPGFGQIPLFSNTANRALARPSISKPCFYANGAEQAAWQALQVFQTVLDVAAYDGKWKSGTSSTSYIRLAQNQ